MPKKNFIFLILTISLGLIFGGLFYLLPTAEVYAQEVWRWHCYAEESGNCAVDGFACALGRTLPDDQTGKYDHLCYGCLCPETGFIYGSGLGRLTWPIQADAVCTAWLGTTVDGEVVCPLGIWKACDVHQMIYHACQDCGVTCNPGCPGVCCDNMVVNKPGGSIAGHDSKTCQACVPGGCCQSHNVWGWAWSENIGWISFSCKNCSGDPRPAACPAGDSTNYGVDIDANGNLSGHAWSENIGWISFNSVDLIGCPAGPCEAKVSTSTGQVFGWARALAYGDGWDGWIKLRGTIQIGGTYGVWLDTSVSPTEFREWAWGSDVVGWISFNCKNCEGNASCDKQATCNGTHKDYKVMTNFSFVSPTVDFKANGSDGPITINYNTSATLSWTSTNANSCTAFGDWSGGKATSGSQLTGNLISSKTYTLTCTGPGGSAPDSVTVNVSAAPNQPPYIESKTVSESYCNVFAGQGRVDFQWIYRDDDLDHQTQFDFRVNDVNNVNDASPEIDRSVIVNPPNNLDGNTNSQVVLVGSEINFNTPYYWWAKVYDNQGNDSGWVAGPSFTTDAHAYPYPDFTHIPQNPSAGQVITFTDTSDCYFSPGNTEYDCQDDSLGVIQYAWDFDYDTPPDFTDSYNEGDATTTYSQPKTPGYEVRLKITDNTLPGPDNYCIGKGDSPVGISPSLPNWTEVPPF